MRHHLTSLHESIWDIVEFGAQVPQVGDKDYDSNEVTQIQHFNSQATSILLASLCREEYNCGRTSQVIRPTCTCPCLKDLIRLCMCTR
jgi:hypothetical protein